MEFHIIFTSHQVLLKIFFQPLKSGKTICNLYYLYKYRHQAKFGPLAMVCLFLLLVNNGEPFKGFKTRNWPDLAFLVGSSFWQQWGRCIWERRAWGKKDTKSCQMFPVERRHGVPSWTLCNKSVNTRIPPGVPSLRYYCPHLSLPPCLLLLHHTPPHLTFPSQTHTSC